MGYMLPLTYVWDGKSSRGRCLGIVFTSKELVLLLNFHWLWLSVCHAWISLLLNFLAGRRGAACLSIYSDESRMQADHNVHLNSALHCQYDVVAPELYTLAHLPFPSLCLDGSLASVRRAPFHASQLPHLSL